MSETPQENGPWSVNEAGDRIDSGDFTHDASLIVYGDFADDEQKRKYAQLIADRLNALTAQPIAGEPVAWHFPTMLRKMWSGGEVQEWLNSLPPLYTHPTPTESSPESVVVPREPDDAWAERFCALVNWHPDGSESKIVEGEFRHTSFRDLAKGYIRAMLAASPDAQKGES